MWNTILHAYPFYQSFNVVEYEILTAHVKNGTVSQSSQNYTPSHPRTPYSTYNVLFAPAFSTWWAVTATIERKISRNHRNHRWWSIQICLYFTHTQRISYQFPWIQNCLYQDLLCHLASVKRNFIQGHFRICKKQIADILLFIWWVGVNCPILVWKGSLIGCFSGESR